MESPLETLPADAVEDAAVALRAAAMTPATRWRTAAR
jgi:hypothetical protein